MGIVPTTGFWPLFSPLLKGATKTDGNLFQANDKLEQFAVYLSLKPSATWSIASKKSALEFDSAWLRARSILTMRS